MIVLGIDPGLGGALAWVSTNNGGIDLLRVEDMPVTEERGRRIINGNALLDLIDALAFGLVVVETIETRPGNGAVAAMKTGFGGGLIHGLLIGRVVPAPIIMARASIWKRQAGVPADKGACRTMARNLWPAQAARFARVKDDGRADAALLARWGAMYHGGKP